MKKTSPVPKIDWTDNLADYKDKVVAIAKAVGDVSVKDVVGASIAPIKTAVKVQIKTLDAIKNMVGSSPSSSSMASVVPAIKPTAQKSADSYGSPKPQFRRSADAYISPAPKKKVNGDRSSSYANYMDAKEYNNPKKPKSRK